MLFCAKYVKTVREEIGEIVGCLHDQKKSAPSQAVATADHAQSLPWPAPNIWLTTSQISSKLVHFWWSYRRPREGRSLSPLGKSNTRPKRYIALGE